MKDSFIIHNSFYAPIKGLSDNQLGRLFKALFEYQINGNNSVEEDISMAFLFFKNQMDIDGEKYQKTIERNKKNGMKGGRPKESDKPKKTSGLNNNPNNPNEPKKADNDNDNVNDIKKESTNVDKKETSVSSHSPDYLKFNEWMKRKAPYCSNTKNFPSQITESELLKLKEKYSGQEIADIIEQIENRKDLRKRYTNLYRTVLNWAKKEYGK